MHQHAMRLILTCIVIGCWTVAFSEESKGTSEQLLIKYLLSNYSTNSRPVLNPRSPVSVQLAAQLIRIDSVSEVGQSLRTKIHLKQTWTNHLLTWNPAQYGGVQEILVSQDDIWQPNLHLFNEASQSEKENSKTPSVNTKITLTHDGNSTLTYAAFYKSTCAIDVTYFPFDEQRCVLEFGSWSQDQHQLQLTASQADSLDDRSEYEENGEWHVDSAVLADSMVHYRLNVRPHSTVRLTIELKRKFFYYMMNLVIPCAMIASMIFLVFVLPPKSGERISLGITVLLSMAIFQELSSEKLPSSSDNFPLLGIYYAVSMFEIGLAMCLNCLVLNFYHRNYAMPPWIRRLLLGRAADLFRVHVPPSRRHNSLISQLMPRYMLKPELSVSPENQTTHSGKMSKLNGNEADTGVNASGLVAVSTRNGSCTSTASRILQSSPGSRNRPSSMHSFSMAERGSRGQLEPDTNAPKQPSTTTEDGEDPDDTKKHMEDWKIAARVLDRALLVISVFIGVLSAAVIFLQARRFREMLLFT